MLAATEGIVLRLDETPVGGKVVWVLGPAGHHHYYAHLDRFGSISAGNRIRTGTLLGYVGNTGNARTTPPHLHYGVYADQGAINPYPLLTGRSGRISRSDGDANKDPTLALLKLRTGRHDTLRR